MKLHATLFLAAAIAWQAAAQGNHTVPGQSSAQDAAGKPEAAELEVNRENVSYAVGMDMGNYIKRNEYEFDVDVLTQAIKDMVSGKTTRMTENQARSVGQRWQRELRATMEAKRKTDGEKNKKAGAEFLAANAKKEGVKTTASGLQYKIITEGTGAVPQSNDVVKVHYRGTLIDGKEFDSSFKRNQPAEFPVTGVIKGWTEALQMMKTGSKWELTIPAELAYGEMGRPNIPPSSVLVFEVELLEIKSKTPEESVQAVSGEIIKVPSADEMKKGAKIEVLKEEDVKRLQEQNRTNAPRPQPK